MPGCATRIAALLGTPAFRVYGNDDPVGAELGGAAKNVMAIAAGAVMGAGLGENARAALITRGLAELSRLAAALGGRAETVMGLSGLGDLLLTCTGQASRNYSFGLALGRGESHGRGAGRLTGVIEGVTTAPALVARAGGSGAADLRRSRRAAGRVGGPCSRPSPRCCLARARTNERTPLPQRGAEAPLANAWRGIYA